MIVYPHKYKIVNAFVVHNGGEYELRWKKRYGAYGYSPIKHSGDFDRCIVFAGSRILAQFMHSTSIKYRVTAKFKSKALLIIKEGRDIVITNTDNMIVFDELHTQI